MTRHPCAKCPWKVTTDPHEIPRGYSVEKHHNLLDSTIAEPGRLGPPTRLMACHESCASNELPCVGWLVQQLGEGNNIQLRLAVMKGRIDGNIETVGEQHRRLEDTFPD